jgi:dihydrofolate reductase
LVLQRRTDNDCGEEHLQREENTMGRVRFSLSASLDGFIADTTDGISEVFAWMGSAMEHWLEVEGDQINQVGAVIMGHRSFDQIGEDWWIVPHGTSQSWPVIVLQSQPREDVQLGKTHYSFETAGIESAIARAQEIAGEKAVALHGASSVQQALKAGLLDEFHLHIAHVLLGEGVRLFDHLGKEPIHLERRATLETPGATHLKFRVLT